MGYLGNLGIFGNFREIRDFKGILGIFGIFYRTLTEKCESDFFGVITDVSTEIRMCLQKEILSANKPRICGF